MKINMESKSSAADEKMEQISSPKRRLLEAKMQDAFIDQDVSFLLPLFLIFVPNSYSDFIAFIYADKDSRISTNNKRGIPKCCGKCFASSHGRLSEAVTAPQISKKFRRSRLRYEDVGLNRLYMFLIEFLL